MIKSAPKTGPASLPIGESLTSFRGAIGFASWVRKGKMLLPGGKEYVGPYTELIIVRQKDWLSAKLQDTITKAPLGAAVFSNVLILTPSGVFVTLHDVDLVSVGPAVWMDPKHIRPIGMSEGITYSCKRVEVTGKPISPATYDWWALNS